MEQLEFENRQLREDARARDGEFEGFRNTKIAIEQEERENKRQIMRQKSENAENIQKIKILEKELITKDEQLQRMAENF